MSHFLRLFAVFFALDSCLSAADLVKPPLLLFVTRHDTPHKDLAAMTLATMCDKAGVLFDSYQASAHMEGGLFAPHGSTVIGGAHSLRIARALASFEVTVVRMDGVLLFDSLFQSGAKRVIDWDGKLLPLYLIVAKQLGVPAPAGLTLIDTSAKSFRAAACWPEVFFRNAWAFPLQQTAEEITALKQAGLASGYTIAPADAD
ncbi:MAG: hypothetical protein H7Y36_07565, partial [Armatimonadetes bacterium]|nr:hypothetical protein [Akkermansiaceae bacterium]